MQLHKLINSMTYNIIFGVFSIIGILNSFWLLHERHLELSQLSILVTFVMIGLWLVALINFIIHWMQTPKSFPQL